jgi:hypothetical protein
VSVKPAATAVLTVFDGEQAIGFILRRGPAGVEAFSAAEISLGLFETEDNAASAIWKHARGQALDRAHVS